jgi:imidazolonepropionase-like amidohydrolase
MRGRDLIVAAESTFRDGKIVRGPQYIVVRDGRIAAIHAERPSIDGAETVDASAATVLPGLIDAHVHLFDFKAVTDAATMAEFVATGIQARLHAFLAHGITTVKSCGDAEDEILIIRARIEAGKLLGPRVLAVGPGLTAPRGHPAASVYAANPWYSALAAAEVDKPEAARDAVRRLAEKGVDGIKLLYQGGCSHEEPYFFKSVMFPSQFQIFRLKESVMRAAIEEAHRWNLGVTVHTHEEDRARTAVECGANALEHGILRVPIANDGLIGLLRERAVTVAPTLTIGRCHPDSLGNVKRMHDGGVGLALGTDLNQMFDDWGRCSIDEVDSMIRAGLNPAQAIEVATAGAARHVGRSGDLGSIGPGKLADLVVVDGNPVENITALRRIVLVIKDGEIVIDNRAAHAAAPGLRERMN